MAIRAVTDSNRGMSPTAAAETPDDDELRLRLYESLEHQVERERGSRQRRLLWGSLAIAGIFGYALSVGPTGFVALTPILFGVLVLDGLRSTVTIWYLQRHLIQVEAKLREREPLFAWVSSYGSLAGGRTLELADVDLNEIPRVALYVLLVTVYLALVVLALEVWPEGESTSAVTVPVTRDLLLLGYGTFTVLFALIVGVTYLNYRRLRRSVADLLVESDLDEG